MGSGPWTEDAFTVLPAGAPDVGCRLATNGFRPPTRTSSARWRLDPAYQRRLPADQALPAHQDRGRPSHDRGHHLGPAPHACGGRRSGALGTAGWVGVRCAGMTET